MSKGINCNTVVIDKKGYTLEVWDTMNWSAEFIRKTIPEPAASDIIAYWGK